MSDNVNEAIRLKSLIFWLDQVQRSDELSMMRRFWNRKDYESFQSSYAVCPWCHGLPVVDLINGSQPVIIHGILIERVQCYCLTLKHLSRTESRWYESRYTDTSINDLRPIDIPAGAAKRTAVIKEKIVKFLSNPTRSALINGGTGTGKTHILQSIKTAFGGFVTYITLSHFFEKLMFHTTTRDGKLPTFINNLTYAPILCLDDFGLGKQSDYGTDVIASIIDSRYNRRRLAPTIMTTNMTLSEMQQVEGLPIGNLERILSRMMDSENSTIMTMLQKDYRQKTVRKEAMV